jgi:membrane protease YdiL (CAAX protease family)
LSSLGRGGLVYTAVIFAVLHMGYQSWLDLIFVITVALFFGWVVQRSGSILGVTLAHGLINISLFLVFPFLLPA